MTGRCGGFGRMVDLRFRFEHYSAKAAEAMENARHAADEDMCEKCLVAAQWWAQLARQVEEQMGRLLK
jgi:hypothetical protein